MRWLRPTRNALAFVLACALLCACNDGYDANLGPPSQPADDLAVCLAHLHHTSHVESVTDGTVTRATGKRPQRKGFALRAASLCKISVFVETATDFAGTLRAHPHDLVTVKGEYEYTPQGGVIRWTYTDPAYHHVGGWINIAGRTYR